MNEEQKNKKKEFKQKEKERLVEILPMPEKLLKEFFDYLDEKLTEGDSGNSLRLTETFCTKKNLDFEKVKEWAGELGGFDDAEILWNCEQEYEFLIGEGGN
ncbi:MAG: DUF2695 domain-containing protein [Chitinophagaceae bacterium]